MYGNNGKGVAGVGEGAGVGLRQEAGGGLDQWRRRQGRGDTRPTSFPSPPSVSLTSRLLAFVHYPPSKLAAQANRPCRIASYGSNLLAEIQLL